MKRPNECPPRVGPLVSPCYLAQTGALLTADYELASLIKASVTAFLHAPISCIIARKPKAGDRTMANLEMLGEPALAPGRHPTVPVLSKRDENMLMKTRRLSRAVMEIYDDRLRPFGIRAMQFSLLRIIGQVQSTTRADIARKQELEKSTLTRDLKSIFAKGWVEEVQQGANGRSRPIALTKAGKQLLHDADADWRSAEEEVVALLRQSGFTAG